MELTNYGKMRCTILTHKQSKTKELHYSNNHKGSNAANMGKISSAENKLHTTYQDYSLQAAMRPVESTTTGKLTGSNAASKKQLVQICTN